MSMFMFMCALALARPASAAATRAHRCVLLLTRQLRSVALSCTTHSLCARISASPSPSQAANMPVAKAVSPPMDKQVGGNISTLPELTKEPAMTSNVKDAVANPAEIRGCPPQRDVDHENTRTTMADITHGITTKQVRAPAVAAACTAPWHGPSDAAPARAAAERCPRTRVASRPGGRT